MKLVCIKGGGLTLGKVYDGDITNAVSNPAIVYIIEAGICKVFIETNDDFHSAYYTMEYFNTVEERRDQKLSEILK